MAFLHSGLLLPESLGIAQGDKHITDPIEKITSYKRRNFRNFYLFSSGNEGEFPVGKTTLFRATVHDEDVFPCVAMLSYRRRKSGGPDSCSTPSKFAAIDTLLHLPVIYVCCSIKKNIFAQKVVNVNR